MRQMRCERCSKNYSAGKFCLDCGSTLKELLTKEVKFSKVKTARNVEQLRRDVYNWLSRLGVQKGDVQISTTNEGCSVTYLLSGKKYTFSSTLQDSMTYNLAAVEQFLHYRVIGIERGIEQVENAFKGYEQLPYIKEGEEDPWHSLGFEGPVDIDTARSKFRSRIKEVHPDVNDSPEAARQFQTMKRAMDRIEEMNR